MPCTRAITGTGSRWMRQHHAAALREQPLVVVERRLRRASPSGRGRRRRPCPRRRSPPRAPARRRQCGRAAACSAASMRFGQRVEGLRPVQRQRDARRARRSRCSTSGVSAAGHRSGLLFDGAGRLRALAQLELLDLAGARSSGSPRSGPRAAPCSRPAAPCSARPVRPALTVAPAFSLDEGHRRLAPLRVGPRDHRAGQHRRVAVQRVLDLDRADVLAAAR